MYHTEYSTIRLQTGRTLLENSTELITNMIANMGKNKGVSMETLEKICNALKADNLPLSEYTVNTGDIMIKFTGPEDRIIRLSDRVNDKVNVYVNDRQKELLSYLIQDPGYTVSQLSEIMKVSRKTIAGHLKALKEKGIIERVGSARNGYWKIAN